MGNIIRTLPLGVFIVVVAFPLAMAGIAVFAGLHARRRAAIVAAMPTSPIGTAGDGYRELSGTVEPIDRQTLTAPLTGTAVCWFHAKLEEYVRRGKDISDGTWTTVREATSSTPFFVRDGTGVATVLPYGAEVTPTDKSVWYGGSPTPSDRNPPKLKPTESPNVGLVVAGGSNRRYRYTEERIYAGDPLLVHGQFSSGRLSGDAAPDAADEDDEEEAAVVDEPARARDAWDADDREDELVERARRVTTATIGRGTGTSPFMMTTTSEQEHLRLTSTGSSAAIGIALVPLALALLLLWVRFG